MLLITIERTCFCASGRALATKQLFISCSKVHKPCVLRHTAMSIVEDIEKLIFEMERRKNIATEI